ncbi:MAG: heat-inducible transcriptional repressor HrcA [Candidatus Scalindua sp.]
MGELSERSQKILWAIIQSHIACNAPVGSFMVTKKISLGLSSATIRNTMANLEELGYVTQPYTSAGRVPTERGYKLYVNTLLKERTLAIDKTLFQKLSGKLRLIENDINRLVKEAAKTLSLFSQYLAIVTPPRIDEMILKHIKFIKCGKKKALCILISEEGMIKNKVIDLKEIHSQKQLDKIADYLNKELNVLTLREAREKIVSQLFKEKMSCDKLISSALLMCKDITAGEADNISMDGLSGTCNLPDFASMKQMKEILKAIEDKHLMIKSLHQVSGTQGVQVFIGMENILPAMKDLSMVISTYNDKKRACGTIGIIGPTRMNYKKLIPIVDHTAKTLTQILSGT